MTIDAANNAFWSELCGSHAARRLGINDDSAESLKKFDDWYLRFYPYLERYLPQGSLAGKRVLEIGLGYGTVSSLLMRRGADYTGLDVAAGPVSMNQHRANLLGVKAHSLQGSACSIPFEDECFDHVVSIGCLHHTGDLPQAISEVTRVLKPSGQAHIMVYNALSYRQWFRNPINTFQKSRQAVEEMSLVSIEDVRYDSNVSGEAAPETVYVKNSELLKMFGPHMETEVKLENIGNDGLLRLIPRKLKNKLLGPYLGLDIYSISRKLPKNS